MKYSETEYSVEWISFAEICMGLENVAAQKPCLNIGQLVTKYGQEIFG